MINKNVFLSNKNIFYSMNLLILIILLIIYKTDYSQTIIDKFKIIKSSNKKYDSIKSNKFNKWIIVTTINPPTNQIKILSNINQFQLLVVGDLKTDPSWKYNKAVYLDVNIM